MCNYCFSRDKKDATKFTLEKNRNIARYFGLNQQKCTNEEYELAKEKCIYPVKEMLIRDQAGQEVWNLKAFDFFEEDSVPDTVNASLWLNGKSNYLAGVFEVVKDAIYQVRGFDISNLTIIRSEHGWIVQDVMSSIETSRAALELLEKALKEPVIDKITAVIISHSHGDHFGGIKGVVTPEQVGAASEGKIPIYVPAGFDEECVKENIFAGTAMSRRASYQFGFDLVPGEKGVISTGLGLASPNGNSSFITPTDYIDHNQKIEIDGIQIEFQITPGTEAPAEMNNYYVNYRALWMAENCCGTLHNTYPIRGAQLRDASAWTDYILEAMEEFADRSDVVFQSHNWPHFNTPEKPNMVREYLLNNAAIYKHIHDQTLLFANQGYTAKEIAQKVKIPKVLEKNWYTRPYYGSVPINSRAVYTKYLGFFNGNPNDVDPLTEVEQARLFVEYAGPKEKIIENAVKDFKNGEYKKAAFAAAQVVYADPSYEDAKLLCADAFEQLGYVAESSIWRNAYLQGAQELRNGIAVKPKKIKKGNDMAKCMSEELLLKYIGILLQNERAEKENFKFQLNIVEEGFSNAETRKYKGKDVPVKKKFIVHLYGGVLLTYPVKEDQEEKYATISKNDLFLWSAKQLKETDIDTNAFEFIDKLQSYLVNLAETADFNLIEPSI